MVLFICLTPSIKLNHQEGTKVDPGSHVRTMGMFVVVIDQALVLRSLFPLFEAGPVI